MGQNLRIKKIYKDVTFKGLGEERIRKIVDEYSTSFRVEMDNEMASAVVKEIIVNEN